MNDLQDAYKKAFEELANNEQVILREYWSGIKGILRREYWDEKRKICCYTYDDNTFYNANTAAGIDSVPQKVVVTDLQNLIPLIVPEDLRTPSVVMVRWSAKEVSMVIEKYENNVSSFNLN